MFAESPVTIREVAVANMTGNATLHTPRYASAEEGIDRFVDEWSSLTQTYNSTRRQFPERFTEVRHMKVKAVTLDSENIPNVGFIKIDVEGAEHEVLKGSRRTIKKFRPNLLVEIEERHRPGATGDIPAYLNSLGYEGYFLIENALYDIEYFSADSLQRGKVFPGSRDRRYPHYIYNFIFIPAEKQAAKQKLFAYFNVPSQIAPKKQMLVPDTIPA